MGKGNGVDESHENKEAALRLPRPLFIVNALDLVATSCHDWTYCFVQLLDGCAWGGKQ